MASLIYYFPVDLTGVSTTNKVNREPHLLVNVAGTVYRTFSLNHGGFYGGSITLEDSEFNPLTINVDYVVDYKYEDTSDRTGRYVGGVVVIINPAITGIVYASAQMVGGSLAFDLDANAVYMQHLLSNPTYVPTAEGFIGAERQWGPGELESTNWTESTISDINIGLENMAQVIKSGDQLALMNYRQTARQLHEDFVSGVGSELHNHETNYNNPHGLDRNDIGLGNVSNYSVASEVDARNGLTDSSYMTPLRTAQAINTQLISPLTIHATDTNNPHNVTVEQLNVLGRSAINDILNTKLDRDGIAMNADRLVSPVRASMVYNKTPGTVYEQDWVSVAYGNGVFVAIAGNPGGPWRAVTSTDGISWSLRVTPTISVEWKKICFGNGLFVVVGRDGSDNQRIMTSPDGINWTVRSTPGDINLTSVTFGDIYGGRFVAVGHDGVAANQVLTSSDGVTWTLRTGAVEAQWNVIVYGNGTFVALPDSGMSGMYSLDGGVTWGVIPIINRNWTDATYGNGRFVAICSETVGATGNQVAVSTNGIDWYIRTTPYTDIHNWRSIAFGDGYFFAICSDDTYFNMMMSFSGDHWWLRTNRTKGWLSIAYGAGGFAMLTEATTQFIEHDRDEGEGVVTNMTHASVVNRLRSFLPTSLLETNVVNYRRLASGNNFRSILGHTLNGTTWRDPQWFLDYNSIVAKAGVYFMDYAGTETNAVAAISTIYNDITQYPEGTVVLFRVTQQQSVNRRVMRAAMRTPTGWTLI